MLDANDKWGYVDTTGKLVIQCAYEDAWGFYQGYAPVMMGGTFGFIDKQGTLVIPCQYEAAFDFSAGLAPVKDVNNKKWGFIDTAGNTVIPHNFDGTLGFSDGLAAVQDANGKWGYIDTTGSTVIPFTYDFANGFDNGLAPVESAKACGFVDKTGKVVVPLMYENVYHFKEGLAAVEKGGKWGYIDTANKVVIPFEYEEAGSFYDGVAVVKKDDEYGLIKNPLTAAPEPDPEPANPVPSIPDIPETGTGTVKTQTVSLDGASVTLPTVEVKAGSGTLNYVYIRDLAKLLSGSGAQYEVGWDGAVTITKGSAYTEKGVEFADRFSGEVDYVQPTDVTKVDGVVTELKGIRLTDAKGNGYTYYRLRDVGKVLGFNVGWTQERGMFLETDKPYDPNN